MKKVCFIGMLDLRNGFVDITDPAYSRHEWMRRNQLGVMGGFYSCYAIQDSTGTSAAFIVHESIKEDPESFHKLIAYCIDQIGVDTAMAGFFSWKPDFCEAAWNYLLDCRFGRQGEHNPFIYTDAQDGFDGFICDSGDGDGIYNLYAHTNNESNEIDALKLVFSDDEAEE